MADTLECKYFLTNYYGRNQIYTKWNEWKRTKKYKLENINYRDFSHPKVGSVTLVENGDELVIVKQPFSFPKLEPSMVSRSKCFYEISRDYLINGNIEDTASMIGGYEDDKITLVNSCVTKDDQSVPVYGYFYDYGSRNFDILVYPDGSWGSNSD